MRDATRKNRLPNKQLRANRKSLHGCNVLHAQLYLPVVDVLMEIGNLVGLSVLVNVNVPGSWTTIVTRAPTIAALFKFILQIEGRALRPDPDSIPSCIF